MKLGGILYASPGARKDILNNQANGRIMKTPKIALMAIMIRSSQRWAAFVCIIFSLSSKPRERARTSGRAENGQQEAKSPGDFFWPPTSAAIKRTLHISPFTFQS